MFKQHLTRLKPFAAGHFRHIGLDVAFVFATTSLVGASNLSYNALTDSHLSILTAKIFTKFVNFDYLYYLCTQICE